MNRIKYDKNTNRTDCNYSFCEEKENINPNSNYHSVDDITRILNMHYQLHLKNAQTIRKQAAQMQRMQAVIQSIERKLTLQSHPHASISSISKIDSQCQHSIEFFPSQSGTHPRSASSQHQSTKTASKHKQKSRGKASSSKASKVEYGSLCSSTSSPDNHAKLLSSIVERKLNIEKQLKERLKDHLLPGKAITAKTRRTNYITYATER